MSSSQIITPVAGLSVADFYRGKTVLLTGATGFVGKVLLEKLCRSLPDVRRIYILIREKKGMSMQERAEREIFGAELFSPLFAKLGERERVLSQVVAIKGDLREPNLGMSAETYRAITEEVEVIFSVAANVN